MNKQLDFIDFISVLSFIIAIQNLEENEEQTEALKMHLKEQDGVLEEQTEKYLKSINEKLDTLLERMK